MREGAYPGLRLQCEDRAVGRVIIHDQDALAGQVGLVRILVGVRASESRLGQDGEMKGRANSWLAADPHRPAHQLSQALADGQPEASAPVAPGRRGIHLAEGLEQAIHPLL